MTLKRFFWLCLFSAFIAACDDNDLDIDVSGVVINTEFIDLNQIIYKADSTVLMYQHVSMQKATPELYDYYVGYVMQTNKTPDTTFYNSIVQYRRDTMIQLVEREIERNFSDLSVCQDQLEEGFKHLKYHLTDSLIPSHIVFINSNLASSVFCSDKDIAIGLDRYLGYDSEIMKYLPTEYYDWVKRAMDKKFLEVDVVAGWSETHIVNESEGNLASEMIRWGKILYLVHAAFPTKEIHEVLRYSKEQYNWALDNEYAFWKYLVDEKMLFEINEQNKSNFLNPGPTTSGLPVDEGAPDRMGRFTGWRMVNQFMENNGRTIEELLDLNYNDILQEYEID